MTNAPIQPLLARFATATPIIQWVGLSEFASVDQNGQQEAQPNFPFYLRLSPNPDVQARFPSTKEAGYTNWLDEFATIPAGTKLFTVYAWSAPAELGGTEMEIGSINITSQFTTSNWGDEKIYFRHQRMTDDLAIHPEWEHYVPKFEGMFKKPSYMALDQQESDCPFANILQYLQ